MGIGTTLIAGLLVGTSLVQSSTPSASTQRFRYAEMHMGVPFRISVYASDDVVANKAVAEAYKRIAELNKVFSDYDKDSEIARLRQQPAGRPIPISADLEGLLIRSQRISEQTDGAFDVTVGPLVRLWRRARRRKQMPEKELLAKALKSSGFQRFQLKKDRSVVMESEGMRLDFGAIAKGYACDEALRILRSHGITSALVDGGGDIAVSEPPPGKLGWRVQIEPDATDKTSRSLLLKNQAVATSGDRYRFVEIDGKRYSHIVDPRTGVGLTSRLTVTVIAKNAADADAYASAVSVLGTAEGVKFVDSKVGVECQVLDYSKKQRGSKASTGFRFAKPAAAAGP